MENKQTNLFWVMLVAFLATLLVLLKCNSDSRKQIDSLRNEQLLNDTNFVAQSWLDKDSNQHLTIENLKLREEELLKYTKSVEKKLDIKSKQVQSLSVLLTNTSLVKEMIVDTFYTITTDTIHDSIITHKEFNFRFKYQDNYVNVNGVVGSKDFINLQLFDTFTTTTYWKKKWFLGQKTYYIDVFNKNPYTNLQSLKSIQLDTRPPKFLVAPYVGLGYGLNNIVDKSFYPYPTVGICIVPYRFSFKIH